jgi:hypothetical protein
MRLGIQLGIILEKNLIGKPPNVEGLEMAGMSQLIDVVLMLFPTFTNLSIFVGGIPMLFFAIFLFSISFTYRWAMRLTRWAMRHTLWQNNIIHND